MSLSLGLSISRGQGGVAFSPLDIAGLQLWLDGSDISTLFQDSAKTTPVASDGDVVGAMVDKSVNGDDILQATTANKPLYKTAIQNGLSVIQCVTNDYLQGVFGSALSQPHTVFVVAQLDAGAVNDNQDHMLIDGDDGSSRIGFLQADFPAPDGWRMRAGATSLTNGDTDGNWNLINLLFNGASSDMRINGSSKISGDAGTQNADGITVGTRFDGVKGWVGYVAEVLIYDPAVSGADQTAIEDYLNSKWGIY